MKKNEIIEMLRYECDWARKKKERMVEQATTYLLWDVSMIGFALGFADVKRVFDKVFNIQYKQALIGYSILLIVCIALKFCVSAGMKYFYVMQVRKMENIEIDEYKDEFNIEKLIEDYIIILKDYDKTIEEYTGILTKANQFLFIGATLLVIGIIILKIIV